MVAYEAVDGTASDPPGPDYNIAPTDPVLTVRTRVRDGVRELSVARWGLVPSWAPDLRRAARHINARAETVQRQPAFRSAFARRRCLVPADGWYEWVRDGTGPGKQAYYLTPRNGGGLVFAGLWDSWGPQRLLTVTIVTTAAVGPLVRVHARMPLVLPRGRHRGWLDPAHPDPAEFLAPPAEDLLAELEIRPVGPAVGNVANDGPDLTRHRDPDPDADRDPIAPLLF